MDWSRHVFCAIRVELERSSFSIEFCSLADFGGLVNDFQLRQVGRDKVVGEAPRSVSHASLGAKNESCALGHVVGVA